MRKSILPDNRAGEAAARLRQLQKPRDVELAHYEADKVLCELLRSLNFDDVVDEWEKVDKWYA